MRKLALLVISAAAVAVAFAGPAGAASGGGCQLAGNASFSPGLGATSKAFTYSFAGNLTGCNSSMAGAPTSGTVEAGKTITVTYPNADGLGGTHTVTYQEPIGTGTGGCSNSTTAGVAIVRWTGGGTTVIKYTTTGAAAAVALTGSVVPSVTANAVSGAQAGDPTSITITTDKYAGYSSGGPLAFQPPDPTACNTAAGVTAAGISGFVGLGSQS